MWPKAGKAHEVLAQCWVCEKGYNDNDGDDDGGDIYCQELPVKSLDLVLPGCKREG